MARFQFSLRKACAILILLAIPLAVLSRAYALREEERERCRVMIKKRCIHRLSVVIDTSLIRVIIAS